MEMSWCPLQLVNNTVYDLFPANLEFLTLSLKLSEVDLGFFGFLLVWDFVVF